MTSVVASFLHLHTNPLSLLNPHSNPNPKIYPKPLPFSSRPISTITTSIPNSNSNSETSEIRVCNNRTCRRQGSIQTLETLAGIAPPNVVVKSCGCLGRCGSGPNIVALPGPTMVSHCGTPNRAAGVLVKLLGGGSELEEEARKCLDALALRKRAELELSAGNCSEAESLYSQAINLKPFGGLHVAYVGRSAVRLRIGNFTGALADAEEALTLSPNYTEAYICRGDAFMGMDQLYEAEEAYSMALEKDPSIRRSKSFKARISTLEERLVSTSVH